MFPVGSSVENALTLLLWHRIVPARVWWSCWTRCWGRAQSLQSQGYQPQIQLHDTWPPGRARSSNQSVTLFWVQSQEEDGEGMEDAAELLGALQHVAVPGAFTLFATDPAKVRVLQFSLCQCVFNPVGHL